MLRWRFTLNPDTDNKVISEPKGWESIKFTLRRDRTWHGIFFENSGELGFYDDPTDDTKDAYTFIREEYELQGIEGYVLLKVEMACNDTDDYTAEGTWRLNFEGMRQTRGAECWIQMNLETSDCLMTFKNRYDQPVEFLQNTSFDGTQLDDYTYLGFNLTLPPKTILEQANLNSAGFVGDDGNSHPEVTRADSISSGTGTVTKSAIGYFQFGLQPGPGTAYDEADGSDEINTRNPISDGSSDTYADLQMNYNIAIAGTYTFSFNIQGRINASVETNANNPDCSGDEDKFNHIEYQVYIKAGGTTDMIYSDSDDGCFTTYEFTSIPMGGAGLGLTYDLLAGDTVQIYLRVMVEGTWDHPLLGSRDLNWSISFDGSASMDIVAYTLSPSSTCVANMVYETGARILEKITNDCLRLSSDYYGRTDSEPYPAPSGVNGCGSLRALMLGLDIRQYTSGRLSLSFKKYFDDLNAIDNIGLGLEDDTERAGYQVVRMENYKHFYENTVVLTLDKVPLVSIEVIREDFVSIFKGGYAKYEAEEYLGLDEFLTERNYRTNLSSTRNTISQVCGMIASGYAIEITRRQKLYSATTAEDWRFDNDVFIVCLNPKSGGVYTVEQGNITGGTDMIAPETVYNYRISPARNAMRWLSTILNSYRDPQGPDSQVIFTDGKGNILASGLMTGACLEEAAAVTENQTLDYTVTDDPADSLPIYIPEAWKFSYPLSFSEYLTLKANPKGTIQARFGQETEFIEFFLRMVEIDPNRQTAEWTLMPKRSWPIDPCQIYIVQTRGTGTTIFGSSLLIGADLENLFVFVNGNLQKYNDASDDNNEIDDWDDTTGYGNLKAPIPYGQQVSIIHLPAIGVACGDCIRRYEGRATGTDEEVLTGYGPTSEASTFFFINGRLQKYNDADSDNNEMVDYVSMSETLNLNYATVAGQEIRAFGFRTECDNLIIYNGQADGTNNPAVEDLGIGTLANIFVFINGSLQIYNDSDTTANQILAYDSGAETVTLNSDNKPSAGREVRAFKLTN